MLQTVIMYTVISGDETMLKKEDPVMNFDKSILSKLTDEQKKQVEAAKTPEELLALAKEAGYDLTSGQLEVFCGGKGSRFCNDSDYCTRNTCGWNW